VSNLVGFDINGLNKGFAVFRNGGPTIFPRVIELLLVGLLGLTLAKIAIAVFAPLPTPKGDVVGAAMSTQSSTRERGPTDAKNPFHSVAVVAGPVEDIPDVAETSLDLTLTGVWPNGDEGSAIIRRSDGKEKRHAVGETITSGVRLVALEAVVNPPLWFGKKSGAKKGISGRSTVCSVCSGSPQLNP